MRLIDSAPPDARQNLALDAALFEAMEEHGAEETLRLWESREPAVVVGSFGAIAREVNAQTCLADGVPVLRRRSGGGAVVVGRGCLNYSLTLSLDARPALRDVARSYGVILRRIAEALEGQHVEVAGASDLAVGGRKVGGSAQRRGRRALLHHGTVLYGFDVTAMDRYLKHPPREPAYRAGRCHPEFVTNVPIEAAAIAAALVAAFAERSS